MLTEQLSDFLYEVRYDSLPSKAVDNAKLYLEDLLGVAAAGSVQPQGYLAQLLCRRGRTAGGDRLEQRTGAVLLRTCCRAERSVRPCHGYGRRAQRLHHPPGAVTIPRRWRWGRGFTAPGVRCWLPLPRATRLAHGWGGHQPRLLPLLAYHWSGGGALLCRGGGQADGAGPEETAARHWLGRDAGGRPVAVLEDGAMSKTLHTANGTLCGLRSARLAALGFTAAEDILAGDRGLLKPWRRITTRS